MPATDWKEQIADDEEARFARHAEVFADLQRRRAAGGPAARALHAKANLGLEAQLEVLPDLPAHARAGMFAEPRTYRALVRYSNGAGQRQADPKPDVRGIAVKVFGVAGKKVIPGMEAATTQDFLAIRTPSQPVRNADEFVALIRAVQSPALLPFKLIGSLGFGRGIRLLRQLIAGLKLPMTPLAATSYYSTLPIRYGAYAVHYSFAAIDEAAPIKGATATYLGDALAARLRERPVVYDVRVRFFESETVTPIEDPTVEWKTEPVTIGRLTLPVQDAESERGKQLAALVEKLSFDPWHALEEHRPLGNMMRARNHAYRASTLGRGASPEPDAFPEL